jgi:hypothetical protein
MGNCRCRVAASQLDLSEGGQRIGDPPVPSVGARPPGILSAGDKCPLQLPLRSSRPMPRFEVLSKMILKALLLVVGIVGCCPAPISPKDLLGAGPSPDDRSARRLVRRSDRNGVGLTLTIEQLRIPATVAMKISLTNFSAIHGSWLNAHPKIGDCGDRSREAEVKICLLDGNLREVPNLCEDNDVVKSVADFVALPLNGNMSFDVSLDSHCYSLVPGEVIFVQSSYSGLQSWPDAPLGASTPMKSVWADDWTKFASLGIGKMR